MRSKHYIAGLGALFVASLIVAISLFVIPEILNQFKNAERVKRQSALTHLYLTCVNLDPKDVAPSGSKVLSIIEHPAVKESDEGAYNLLATAALSGALYAPVDSPSGVVLIWKLDSGEIQMYDGARIVFDEK